MKRLFLLIMIFLSVLFIYQYYPYSPISDNIVVDKIIVNKSERKLMVYSNGSIIKTFTVSLGDQLKNRLSDLLFG
jgi:ABC-type bacteriocin/lantibiotic exporter with double-glycine peptidase domain